MSRNPVVWIDAERCTACGACTEACPVGAITLAGDSAQVDATVCTGCMACLDDCPQGAIQPAVKGELIPAQERSVASRAPSRAPAVQRTLPLVEAAAPALAIAGAGLLAEATRAVAAAVGRWLTGPAEGTSTVWPPDQVQRDTYTSRGAGRANGRGRRKRRRRGR